MHDSGLSRLQRELLREIWLAYQKQAPRDYKLNDGSSALEYWGVRWSGRHVEVKRRSQSWTGRGQSASQRAADSRALRRLEQRGLIVRMHRFTWREGPYTNYVRLTDEEKAVAQRLTSV